MTYLMPGSFVAFKFRIRGFFSFPPMLGTFASVELIDDVFA